MTASCDIVENGERCPNGRYGHGMCQKHWKRWRRHGDPLVVREGGHTPAAPRSLADNLWARVDRSAGLDGCWPCTGGLDAMGYAYVSSRITGRKVRRGAHVVAYEDAKGSVPLGKSVGHRCHDIAVLAGSCAGGPTCPHRACCNPAHLEAQTHQEQMAAAAPSHKVECIHGHPYTPDNTYIAPGTGRRSCRRCRRKHGEDRQRRLRETS